MLTKRQNELRYMMKIRKRKYRIRAKISNAYSKLTQFLDALIFKHFQNLCPYLSILVHTCPYLSVLVRTCPYLSVLVCTSPYLSVLVRTCPYLSVLVRTCPYLSVLVRTCPYLSVFFRTCHLYGNYMATTWINYFKQILS